MEEILSDLNKKILFYIFLLKENKLTVDQFNQELKYFKSLLKDDVKDWPKECCNF